MNIINSEIITVDDANKGYAITTFNPVDMTIQNGTIKGWACLNLKGADNSAGSSGSTITVNGAVLESNNGTPGTTNSYSLIKIEDDNVNINITNSEMNVNGADNTQSLVSFQKLDLTNSANCTVTLGEGNFVTLEGDYKFASNTGNTSKLEISGGAFNVAVPAACAADGYEPTGEVLPGTNRYTVDHMTPEANKSYLRITKTDDTDTQSYKVYQLFKATVTDKDMAGKLASDITWVNDDTKGIILTYLDGHGYNEWLATNHPGDGQHDLAQNAAEFIATQINGSSTASGTNTEPRTTAGNSFANDFAAALANNTALIKAGSVRAGAILELPESGYYLVTSDTIPDGYAGTAPIWLPWTAAEGVTDITPKTALPTLEKKVQEGDTFGEIADAGLGNAVNFKVTATLPDNYGAYGKYSLVLTDDIPVGLNIDMSSVAVSHVPSNSSATPVTAEAMSAAASIGSILVDGTMTADKLVVEFADLSQVAGLSAGDAIVITYTATLNSSAAIGLSDEALGANTNTATLTYSNDPDNADSTGETEDTASVATYQLNVLKVDKGTDAPLSGIKFTLKQGNQFVQGDGSLDDDEYAFTTENGTFSIPRIDAGTYTLDELTDDLPSGYTAISNLSVVIRSTLSGTPSLTVTTDNANVVSATADTASGIVSLKVSNTKEIVLPITGMTPSQLATVLGMVLLATGTVLMVVYVSKNRKQQ